jgi:mono/diheme cytochrome c family protein
MVRPLILIAFAAVLLLMDVFPPPREPTDMWGHLGRPAREATAEAGAYTPDARFVKEAPKEAVAAVVVPEGERLYAKSGCAGCHAPGAPFFEKLANAKGKPDQVVAAWILNPRVTKPDTLMPPFANQLSEAQALTLARWVKEGNAGTR